MSNYAVQVHLAENTKDAIWAHLLPDVHDVEEAAFLYARTEGASDALRLVCIDWEPVPPSGFRHQTDVYLELADSTKAAVIKRAHDLNASLVELHSHTGPWPAQFSPSDLDGFRDFVPHVFWRLKRRPYLAIVATRSGFDAMAWIASPRSAVPVDAIIAGCQILRPTGRTFLHATGSSQCKKTGLIATNDSLAERARSGFERRTWPS